MKRMIFCAGIIGILLLTTVASVSGLNAVKDNNLKDLVLIKTNDGRHINLEIKMLYMEDIIDPEDQRTEDTPYFADWLIKIWLIDGIDENGDDYWEYTFGPDRSFILNPGIKHEWSIENIGEKVIKIELYDIDEGGQTELCDLNGASLEKKSVEFKYYPFDNSIDYSGSGGCDMVGYITGSSFGGGDDGTSGENKDDNDVDLVVAVRDNYDPAELKFSENSFNFGDVEVGIPISKNFYLQNVGDFTAQGNLYIKSDPELDFENFIITEGAGEFTLEPDESMRITVKFNPDKYYNMIPLPPPFENKKSYAVYIMADGGDSCFDGELELSGFGIENPDGMPPAKPETPDGSSSGKINNEYSYTTSTTDPEGDDIEYGWDWDGDYIVDDWEGSTASNRWSEEGPYTVRVIARDQNGQYSKWSDPLPVSMPKNKTLNTGLHGFLNKIITQLPLLQRLLKI